jgi:hypothetical protein
MHLLVVYQASLHRVSMPTTRNTNQGLSGVLRQHIPFKYTNPRQGVKARQLAWVHGDCMQASSSFHALDSDCLLMSLALWAFILVSLLPLAWLVPDGAKVGAAR